MNPFEQFAPAYGMTDITGTRLLPDQIQFVPATIQQMVAHEGQSCYSPSFPPANGLICNENFIAVRPKYVPPPSYSEYEFWSGQPFSWNKTPRDRPTRENRYCLL